MRPRRPFSTSFETGSGFVPLGPPSAPPSPEGQAIVDEVLASLPERLRDPAVLCWVEGRFQREAAEMLRTNQSEIHRSLADAKGRIERGLEAQGVPPVFSVPALSLQGVGSSSRSVDQEVDLIFLKDDKHLLAYGNGRIWKFEIKTGKTVWETKTNWSLYWYPDTVAITPDGKELWVLDNKLSRWDIETGKNIRTLRPNWRWENLRFSPDGKTFAFDESGKRIWVGSHHSLNHSKNLGGGMGGVVSKGAAHFLRQFDLSGKELRKQAVEKKSDVEYPFTREPGRVLKPSHAEAPHELLGIEMKKKIGEIPAGWQLISGERNGRLFWRDPEERSVHLLHLKAGAMEPVKPDSEYAHSLTLHPDGKNFAWVGEDGRIAIQEWLSPERSTGSASKRSRSRT